MAPPAPVRFLFRGRSRTASPGESLLRTLGREGLPLLQRSIRYHRPRAPFCGVGFCTQCLVRVNGTPNIRACRYVPRPGDRVETENAWPSPSLDLLGLLDFVFWGGIDTLRGFRRPSAFTPLYQRVVRRLAGYGRIAEATASPPRPTSTTVDADVVVIGGGPAGRAAATRIAEGGRQVALVDRGGLPSPPHGVDPLPHVTAVFLPPPQPEQPRRFTLLGAAEPDRGFLIRARDVVVASGAYDAGLLFAGNDRPGVLTAEAVFPLAGESGDPPFHHALIFGGGRRAAELLDRFGTRVDAIAAPGDISSEVTRRAMEFDILLYPRAVLVAASGRRRIRKVRFVTRARGAGFTVSADALLLAHRRLPHAQLLFQAGARMEWRAGAGAYYPTVDASGATTVPGLFAAGEVAGYSDGVAAEASGLAVAEVVLGRPGRTEEVPGRVPRAGPSGFEGYFREFLRQRRSFGKCVACPCEDVLLEEVEEAATRGFRGLEVVKRYTGVGTGLCQGRYCLPDTLLVLSILENRAPEEVGYITQRPPVVPTPLAALAGLPLMGPEPSSERR